MLPKNLVLYKADWITLSRPNQPAQRMMAYVLGRTKRAAFNRWYKHACRYYGKLDAFDYYFDVIDDEEEIKEFMMQFDDPKEIKADVYYI